MGINSSDAPADKTAARSADSIYQAFPIRDALRPELSRTRYRALALKRQTGLFTYEQK